MSAGKARAAALCACLCAVLGCNAAAGDGSGGAAKVFVADAPDCAGLGPSAFPPGLALLPGDGSRAVALNFEPPGVVPLDLDGEAPRRSRRVPILSIPDDSDGDGQAEGSLGVPDFPQLDDVFVGDPELFAAGLGLVTASGYEEVIVFEPAVGELAEVVIEVDAGFDPADFRRLPEPGSSARRTAISTDACVRPEAPIDSNGNDYAAGVPAQFFCDPAVAGSFYARFTSGAAVASGRLFASMSNLGDGGGTASARFLPGAVLVYDLDLAATPPRVSPNVTTPVIETFAFNPTHVTRVEAAGRELVLVTLTGAIGITDDDPDTPEIEADTLPLSAAAIEVLDPETLEIVGGTPLPPDPDADPLERAAFAFDRLALHPSGRVAVVGSVAGRRLYVIDLAGLETLTMPGDRLTGPLPVLELEVPDLPGGPASASCAGFTGGFAFNDAGDVLYASERCDGSLTRFDVRLPSDPVEPVEPEDFRLLASERLLGSLSADDFGRLRDPGVLRVRQGVPGLDFTGPDLFFLASQPDAQACARRVESL